MVLFSQDKVSQENVSAYKKMLLKQKHKLSLCCQSTKDLLSLNSAHFRLFKKNALSRRELAI